MQEKHLTILRRHMVERIEILAELAAAELGKDRFDARVLEAMTRVPRHAFVPVDLVSLAYENTPLPIGFDKTISQPFIVAAMTDMLALKPTDTVLEIGTGFGYQTSLLAELASQVWTIEIVEELGNEAQRRLKELGYENIGYRIGSGAKGWAEHAPYDAIIVTAAANSVPKELVEQLKPGGRLVLPVGGSDHQRLTLVTKDDAGTVEETRGMAVLFSLLEVV